MEEDRSGRIRWQIPRASANLRDSGDGKGKKPPPAINRDARQGESAPVGAAAVGWRVSVWWKDDVRFYPGTVESFDPESGQRISLDTLEFCREI